MESLSLTELANKYKSDKGTEYFDRHGYTLVYETLFSPLKSKPITFLEIGLCIGGPEFGEQFLNRIPTDMPSIRMWTEYFDNASLYGFDISDFSHLEYEFSNFKFVKGDLSSKQDILNLVAIAVRNEGKENSAVYDVILDDASHASFHQQHAFSILFPYLQPNGIYIIEDLNWQSPNYEETLPKVPKTLDVLREIKNGGELSNDYLFRNEMSGLINEIDSVDLFCDSKLAVIKKSGY
ncbi:hypothetical protein [Roseofilum casamattae]|uniref:Class I SAM-dependent methyltransferase n=1 Tax=Roseofilum casamattae BLCC-M143 TaxID=3022442 RepID=A0ABT7C105_9CYAN|nr:hypothetical protein [Roseofilum casamattae]MDJ1184193.1 hypothetical protein [Roseofilum casamattae BLCC-M143]